MSKIIPLLFVLFVGETIMRHISTGFHMNSLLFIAILLFCLIFWRLIVAIVWFILKAILTVFFIGIFR
ncbi:hypothetical protein EM4838_16085 (plasmid) [Enterococcus mundtii]|uniref:4-hydroxybenzoate octaprenyltransferase n=1 Tax=Enterococcus mundtii TaxID=53346 RepID=A0ABQ0VFI9_ENTMU|nr:hypothetical protein EM4838_15495 [Enterococcus mundtii]AUB54528.1 hypothetical protein EM4838_16085 [Enterococcus mundtii]RYT01790.1 hypothetical protein EAI87_13810 [Enterococcus mundtii]GEL81434.1 4-hydroxybenzoate octaprenyltransferase [Enterococcus mundtii]GEN18589.1 4-hydroxybenzoate octaprenyltransferase [Ligilactobacillus acidipiscis]